MFLSLGRQAIYRYKAGRVGTETACFTHVHARYSQRFRFTASLPFTQRFYTRVSASLVFFVVILMIDYYVA